MGDLGGKGLEQNDISLSLHAWDGILAVRNEMRPHFRINGSFYSFVFLVSLWLDLFALFNLV